MTDQLDPKEQRIAELEDKLKDLRIAELEQKLSRLEGKQNFTKNKTKDSKQKNNKQKPTFLLIIIGTIAFVGLLALAVHSISGPPNHLVFEQNRFIKRVGNKIECSLPPAAKDLGISEAWLVDEIMQDHKTSTRLWYKIDGEWVYQPFIDYCPNR